MKWILFLIAFAIQASQGISQNADSLVVAGTLDSLTKVANKLLVAKKFQEAIPIVQQAADLAYVQWGEFNYWYGFSLSQLAEAYKGLTQFEKSVELCQKVVEIRARISGKESQPYGAALHNLALAYQLMGDYSNAEPLYLEAKEIWLKVLGRYNVSYAEVLNSMAILYYNMGNFAKAEPLYKESLEVRAVVFGKESPEYAVALNGLAIFYKNKGDYADAEPLYMEALNIRAKKLGLKSPDYAASLNNLATLYSSKGDYEKAEQLYLASKDIRAEVYGKQHPLYAQSLNNLANLYYKKGEYAKCEPLYLESIEIRAKKVGKEHPDYATAIDNLASLYFEEGDYVRAEQLYIESNAIKAKALGKEHPQYATTVNSLGYLYMNKGDYTRAEPLMLEAKAIWAGVLGKESPEYASTLSYLATLYQCTDRISEATSLYLEANEDNRSLIERAAAYSSESQMLAYLKTFDKPIDQINSFCQSHPNQDLVNACYDNSLYLNGFLLENVRRIANNIAVANDEAKEAYERWQACRRRLAKEYAKPLKERKYVAEVEAEAEGLEKILLRNQPYLNDARRMPHWQAMQAALKPQEAVVEFIHYEYYNPKMTDSTMYAAIVLRAGDSGPRFVPLFEKKALKALMSGASGGNNFLKINALYSDKFLYELVWKPIEPLLTGVRFIYCRPSGLLHRLNLAAVSTPEGKTYGERRQIMVFGSARQILVANPVLPVVQDAYLAGGIRYDCDSTMLSYANRSIASNRTVSAAPAFEPDSLSINRGGILDYLPATAAEVGEIAGALQHAGYQVNVDTGFYATEESFRRLGVDTPSPRIIHLATHGYFFPDPAVNNKNTFPGNTEPVFRLSDHPMIRSGLLLAGAKQAWLTGKHPEGQEDGILTAYEISQMNLRNTELVVLSACETGLGDIVGNEGVYGLQRAFKIAGARYLIMSLWKVGDQSTRAFMTTFYRHWLKDGQTVPQAFRRTQEEMRAKYTGAYDWAGFVLIE